MVIVEKWANLPPPPALPEAEADSVSEPLPLPVPPDRPVVSILALHKDSKDQKAGKKRVTFADEAGSSDSDVSDKVSSTNGEASSNKVSALEPPPAPSSSGLDDKGDGDKCDKGASGDAGETSEEKADMETVSSVDSDAVSAEKSDSMETEASEGPDGEKLEATSTEAEPDGPLTRHRAKRRPSVIPGTKGKKRGGRGRGNSTENENKDADSTSHKDEAGDPNSQTTADASEMLQASDADTSGVPAEGVPVEDNTENSDQKEDTPLLGFSMFGTAAASGEASEPQEGTELAGSSVKLAEQSEESASLSSESDSTDSDQAAYSAAEPASVTVEERDDEEMPTLTNEATFSEVSYDVEDIDEISSMATDLLAGWSELKVSVTPEKKRGKTKGTKLINVNVISNSDGLRLKFYSA